MTSLCGKTYLPPLRSGLLALGFAVVFVAGIAPREAEAARLFTSGFETNNFTETEWTLIFTNNPVIVTSVVRTGSFAMQVNAAGNSLAERSLPANVTSGSFFVRFYWRFISAPASTTDIAADVNQGGGTNVAIRIRSDGKIDLFNQPTGGTITSANSLSANTWHLIEYRHLLSDTAGEVELRINGISEGSLTGIDTLNSNVRVFQVGQKGGGGQVNCFYDDIAINGDAGTFQNSWPGPGRVVLVKPTFDQSVGWTANPTGSNAANVDDVPGTPDDDTTYNSAAGAATDRLHLSDLPTLMPPTATLTLAHVMGRARSESGTQNLTLRWWNEQGAEIAGPTFNFGTSYEIPATNEMLVVDLSTSTRAHVVTSNIGYAWGAGTVRITALWANVEYTGEIPGGRVVTSRSDILSDSRPSQGSNHTITFTTQSAVMASSTIDIRLPGDFSFPGGLDCGDVDVATSVEFVLSATSVGCEVTATTWGISFAPSPPTLVITAPTSTGSYISTGTVVTIRVGTNATSQQTGTTQITNPATAGSYTINVGGSFGGAGNMLVSILSGVSVEARVAEHLTVAITGVPNWYSTDWGFRKRVRINNSQVAGTATSFPMLVNSTTTSWKHTAWGGNVGSVTGFDFVFTDKDGLTKLDHEIERYASSTGELVSWVRLPFLSSTSINDIFVYYGNAGAADQQNKFGVWNSNFAGVWHLTTTSTNTTLTLDSTANSVTGTKSSPSQPNSIPTGQIDGAQEYSGGTSDAIDLQDTLHIPFPITLEAWINLSSGSITNSIFSNDKFNSHTNHSGVWMLVTSGNTIEVSYSNNTTCLSSGRRSRVSNSTLSPGTWYHVVGVLRGTNDIDIYLNGVLDNGAFSGSATNLVYTSGEGGIGRIANCTSGNMPFDGAIDEVRILSASATTAWIQTEYNNQNNPSAFYTLGGEEPIAQTSCVADDGASVSVVNTTESQVAFGTVSASTFYQGCQDISISTNAGGGYVMTGVMDHPLHTGSGATIPDTNCDNGCDQITAGTWTTPSNTGFGHTCRNQTNNDCNTEYASGTKFRRFSFLSTGGNLAVKAATGTYTGNGASRTISHGLGTTPKVIMLWLDEDAEDAGWVLRTNQHATASSIQFPTGSGNSRLAADMITGMNSTTFSLGTASSVNQTSSSYMWVAYAGNGVGTGAYTGNGNDNRDIAHGMGTSPKMLFAWRDTNNTTEGMCARSDRHSGDTSVCWQPNLSTLKIANLIQAMDGSTFQVGTENHVNGNGIAYKWFGLAGPSVQTGSYTGNGQDNRDIPHELSATPSLTWVWQDDDGSVNGPTARSNQYVGDVSIVFDTGGNPTARAADYIQAMSSTSFQVGTEFAVNESAMPIKWFAVKTSGAQSEVAGETIMASSTLVSIAVGRIKYRLAVPSGQAAGTYTTKVTYIITPTY